MQTLESAALVLATLGDSEHASTLLGYQAAHHPLFGMEIGLGFRERALQLVHEDERADEWMALGASMDRDEIVADAVVHLATMTSEPAGMHTRGS